MVPAIETLMHEHRFIEKVLGSLQTFAGQLTEGNEKDRATVRQYASFFRDFADKCHHGKEEDRLFVKMGEHGFSSQAGPVAVMLSEHVEGREHVGALVSVGNGTGPLTADEVQQVRKHALNYIPLLSQHIKKEDNILYPMAIQSIPEAEMAQLHVEFEIFENKVMGPGAHEKLHAMAESLIAAYPPA